MAKVIQVIKKNGAYYPATDHDKEISDQAREGAAFRLKLSSPRNPDHHRKYLALLNLVFDNLPEGHRLVFGDRVMRIKSVDNLLWHIKMQLGYYENKMTLGGKITMEAKSISFDSMPQEEFNEFYNRSIDVILKYFLQGVDKLELEEMIAIHF